MSLTEYVVSVVARASWPASAYGWQVKFEVAAPCRGPEATGFTSVCRTTQLKEVTAGSTGSDPKRAGPRCGRGLRTHAGPHRPPASRRHRCHRPWKRGGLPKGPLRRHCNYDYTQVSQLSQLGPLAYVLQFLLFRSIRLLKIEAEFMKQKMQSQIGPQPSHDKSHMFIRSAHALAHTPRDD